MNIGKTILFIAIKYSSSIFLRSDLYFKIIHIFTSIYLALKHILFIIEDKINKRPLYIQIINSLQIIF